MSEPQDEPEPEPLMIEITADTTRWTEALQRLAASMMFAFHPDLREGPVRPDEETAT